MVRIIILIFFVSYFCGCENKPINNSEIKDSNEKLTIRFGKKEKKLIFNFRRIEKTTSQRKYKKIETKSLLKFGGIASEMFYYPSRLIVDSKGNIYVIDNLDCSVSKFDSNGNLIIKYGRKGRGPGEFENAFAFDISLNSKVVIASPNDNKFAVFNDANNLVEYKCKLMPNQVKFFSESEIITYQIMDPVNTSPIQKINFKENKVTEYQNFINEKSFNGKQVGMLPFLLGDLHTYQSNKILFVGEILGYVIIYDENGKIENAFKLIENLRYGSLKKREKQTRNISLIRFPKENEYLFEDSNVNDDKLYILTKQIEQKKGEYIIDVYNIYEKEYKYSLILKDMGIIRATYFTQNKLYIIRDNTEIEVYEYLLD